MPSKLPMLDDPQAKKILQELCKRHKLTMQLLVSMLQIQRENLGRGRQHGITGDFSAEIQDFLETRGER